ncbi:MAG: hypothetical protein GTO03_18230, partial [Planctomycetales bacterium]|nr:hypothetical protein [Planctomycetales bacterium]
FLAVCCLCVHGCARADGSVLETNRASAASGPDRSPATGRSVPREDGLGQPDDLALANLLKITPQVYVGGEARGDAAFARLVRMGVKTVVSVDGARPDIPTARRHKLRYVHIPIGYDGIDKRAGLSLASLVRHADGPFYVHCHHGLHRGPAAAAVVCMAAGDVDGPGALQILARAGTSKKYAGLWRDVRRYQVPADDVDLPELVELAEVASLAAAMAKIDRACENLGRCRDAQWSAPPDHPDLIPAQEALLLKEAFRESARNLSDEFGDEFATWLTEAESAAQALEDSLSETNNADESWRRLEVLQRSCRRCHAKYRD